MSSRQIVDQTGFSQPTVSRGLAHLGDEVIRIGSGSSIQYAIRDYSRGFDQVPVYRVSDAGQIRVLGTLVPVRPDGFVMIQIDGVTIYSDGLPWWIFDMRPQGYLGRAYASTHAANLGLPSNPDEWTDSHALRALLAHGYDVVGNLLPRLLIVPKQIHDLLPRLVRVMFPAHQPVESNRSSASIQIAAMPWSSSPQPTITRSPTAGAISCWQHESRTTPHWRRSDARRSCISAES